jgi:hypothetical protein
MGNKLRLYNVTVGAQQTQMRLDERDAKAMGDSAVLVPEPRETQRPAAAPADTKSRLVTSNKMRGTDDKPTAHHPETEHHHG